MRNSASIQPVRFSSSLLAARSGIVSAMIFSAGLAFTGCEERMRGSRLEPDAGNEANQSAVVENKPFQQDDEQGGATRGPSSVGTVLARADASGGTWQEPISAPPMNAQQGQQLAQSVRQGLLRDRSLGLDQAQLEAVQISVEDGRILLSGTVPTRDALEQVEERVHRASGGWRVENQLTVPEAAE